MTTDPPIVLTPKARAGNVHALRHGANSPSQIKRRARAHRRRFLRQIGLRASGLDAIALAYLDGWARALAKVDAYDDDPRHRERDPREYHAAMNSARLWMTRLEERLKEVGLDRGPAGDHESRLHDFIEGRQRG